MLKFLLIVAVLFARSGAWAQTKVSEEKAVLDAEQRWRDAVRTGDAATLSALVADDYITVSITGQVGSKASTVDRAKTMTPEQRAAYEKVEGYFSDTRVRLYGNVAVVTGEGGVRASGLATRFISVWVRNNRGAWQVTTRQVTRIDPPAARGASGNNRDTAPVK